MNDQIESRAAICEDADRAAQRCIEFGVEQLNPNPAGTEAHAQWQAHYDRMRVFYLDPLAEGGA